MNYKRIFIPNSIVFITMVIQDRQSILLEHIDILTKSVDEVKLYYDFEIIAYVVLNDHFHFLMKTEDIKKYPKIIHSIKYNFTKNVGVATPTYKKTKIWQNRYWEHTIRDENDLYKHFDYIHYNSFKHCNIAPKDWKYSSFEKFVSQGYYEKEWYNLNDKYKINELNYE